MIRILKIGERTCTVYIKEESKDASRSEWEVEVSTGNDTRKYSISKDQIPNSQLVDESIIRLAVKEFKKDMKPHWEMQ